MPSLRKISKTDIVKLRGIGLVGLERELPQITDEPKFPSFVCFPERTVSKKYYKKDIYGQGFNEDENTARIKSIAECLERLCLSNLQKDKVKKAKFIENSVFVSPSLFFCYSDEQIGDREREIDELKKNVYLWYPVKNLFSGRRVLIPAQLIFLSNDFKDEPSIRYEKISTGAAFGQKNTNRALRSGFFEVVERDSAVPAYLTGEKLRKIKYLPNDINDLIKYLERYNLETHLLDVTSDLKIPSIISVSIDRSLIGDAVNIGLRSSTRYHEAVKGAIFESIQCRRGSRINKKLTKPCTSLDGKIRNMEERHAYWANPERIKDIENWLSKANEVEYKDLEDITFRNATSSMRRKGYNVFIADITLPEIAKKGFETFKVLIPELHPLYIDENAKALYSKHWGAIKNNPNLRPHPFN